MSETAEIEAAYANVKVGDLSPTRGIQEPVCGFQFLTERDHPDDSPWACTRTPGHAPPHVAETITKIAAVHEEDDSQP